MKIDVVNCVNGVNGIFDMLYIREHIYSENICIYLFLIWDKKTVYTVYKYYKAEKKPINKTYFCKLFCKH